MNATATGLNDTNNNPSPNDFNPHDQPHFPAVPDMAFPPNGFGQHPPPPGAAPVAVEQHRTSQLGSNGSNRTSRKRKTPPVDASRGLNAAFNATRDFTPGGVQLSEAGFPITKDDPLGMSNAGRSLNPSKRAEQNRKAQRAFRERRDVHVKELEARSALLDAALGSADEANRRWEECRQLVDQLRVENTGLRNEVNSLRQALGSAAVAFQQQQAVQAAVDMDSPHINGQDSPGKDDSPLPQHRADERAEAA